MDIFAPHSGQNFGLPSGWWPQPVHVSFGGVVGVPHSGQNFALPTSTPHDEHCEADAAVCCCAGLGARTVEPGLLPTPGAWAVCRAFTYSCSPAASAFARACEEASSS